MVKLTADLCADKRNISTTNMQTPPKEISCSGRCLVSTTSHVTSKPKTTKMKSLKVQLKHVLTLVSLFAALRRSQLRMRISVSFSLSLSPFDPFIEALEDSENRFECPADFFAQVLTRNFVGHSGDGQARQDHKCKGPLKIQYTGCNEVCHITCRAQETNVSLNTLTYWSWTINQMSRWQFIVNSKAHISRCLVLPAPRMPNTMYLKIFECDLT